MNNAELIECLRCENENHGDCSLHESDCKYRFGIYCAYRQKMRDAADALEAADKRIAELEAQLPKEGEWEWLSSTYDRVPREMRYWCSVCHHEEITHDDKPWKHYCPNCGARMRTVTDCHTLEEGER